MGLHRVTMASGSAADARLRVDAQHTYFYNADYHSCDISPSFQTTRPTRQLLSSAVTTRDHARHDTKFCPGDPIQPLLPTTRFYTAPLSSVPRDIHHEPTSDEVEYRPMNIKSGSGLWIGLFCITLVWLLPLGIIISGARSGEIAVKVNSFFKWPSQTLSMDTTPPEPLVWDGLRRGEHCLRYKTREYTAKSLVSGHREDVLRECKQSLAEIHNIKLEPTFCEDLGTWSGIWAHWVVDFEEPDCETRWTEIIDEGCQGTTGLRRFTAKLDRFSRNDNWQIMCSTTPTDYALHEKKLGVPSRCNQVRGDVLGMWEMPDRSCPPVKAVAS